MNETLKSQIETNSEDKSQVFDQEALDKKWYREFEKIGSFQAYDYFDDDKKARAREAEKNKFLSGEVVNPTLDYPKLNKEDIETKIKTLRDLRKKIKAEETNPLVSRVYNWKLNEKICEARMMQASLTGNMRLFELFSEEVYGEPTENIFSFTVKNLQAEIDKASVSENEALKKAAMDLMAVLPQKLPEPDIQVLPKPELVSQVKEITEKQMGDLIVVSEVKEKYNAADIKNAFELALSKLMAEGWEVKVLTESSRSGISVNQEKKIVEIPEKRDLTLENLKTLIAHEIGTHVQRRKNGERSRLMLLGLGLPSYEKGEEGVATMREQVLKNKVLIKDFAGLEYYLSIGLAKGVDGKPRDFREVYEIMEKYFYFKMVKEGKEINLKKAQDSAWNNCVRIFRGTDCQTKGVCFTKDIIYREGSIGVWDVVSKDLKEMTRFDVGKYDPKNPYHISILDMLAITDGDLAALEKEVKKQTGIAQKEFQLRSLKRKLGKVTEKVD
jgi:hypothetical protein